VSCRRVRAAPARVLLAHDSRPSCPGLLAAAVAGANVGCGPGEEVAFSLGEHTTPTLHWAVMQHGQVPLMPRSRVSSGCYSRMNVLCCLRAIGSSK